MQPEELVKILAADAEPVRRLSSPMVRLLIWLGISIAYAAMVVWLMGLRPDILSKLGDTRFVVELSATFMTSVLAAAAAFCAGCPGRPIWERFAPLPALGLWFWSLGEGCWQTFAASGAEGLSFRIDFVCLPSILLVGILPGAVILKMIRQGAPIAPTTTTALATLAAAALGATALRLFHEQDASVMVLVWQFGSVVLLASLGALTGRRLLRWPEPRLAA
jgi:hypothetical protein